MSKGNGKSKKCARDGKRNAPFALGRRDWADLCLNLLLNVHQYTTSNLRKRGPDGGGRWDGSGPKRQLNRGKESRNKMITNQQAKKELTGAPQAPNRRHSFWTAESFIMLRFSSSVQGIGIQSGRFLRPRLLLPPLALRPFAAADDSLNTVSDDEKREIEQTKREREMQAIADKKLKESKCCPLFFLPHLSDSSSSSGTIYSSR